MEKAKLLCIIIVAIAFASTLAVVLSTSKPVGADYYFHLDISTMISKGDVVGAWNYTNTINGFPYGFYLSIWHFALVPTVWSGYPYLFAQILQVLFLPCTLALTMWLTYRFGNPKAAVYAGMVLFASWAFYDGALQVRPESLDLLLYPLIAIAVLSAKKICFVGLALVTVYSHGLAALSSIYGLAVYKLKDKAWRKTILVASLAILPILIISLLYVGGAFHKWVTFGNAGSLVNPQQALFWNDPVGFIPYYMGATMLGIPFLFKRGKSELQKLLLYGLVGSVIMLPFWADRWLHYISLPLAVFAGIGITELKGRWKLIFVLALLDIFIVYTASYFSFSLHVGGARWWQPGD